MNFRGSIVDSVRVTGTFKYFGRLVKLDKFLFESFRYLGGNIDTLEKLKKVCEFVESPQKTVKMKKKRTICIGKPIRFETRKTHQIEREKNPKFQKGSCNRAFIFKTQVYQ